MKTAWIIFPNQLYEDTTLLEGHDVFIVEEPMYIYDAKHRPLKPNKMKVAYLRAAARQYFEECKRDGLTVRYVEYDAMLVGKYDFIHDGGYRRVMIYDPTDHGVIAKLEKYIGGTSAAGGTSATSAAGGTSAAAVPAQAPQLTIVESPNFLLSRGDLKDYDEARGGSRTRTRNGATRHADFYEFVKRRLDILVGTKSQDTYNRLPPPPDADNTRREEDYGTGSKAAISEAIAYAHRIAADHCGDAEYLSTYPTTRDAAYKSFRAFLRKRFNKFGPYEDAFLEDNPFMYHSVASAALNVGLLDPRRLVDLVMGEASVPLNSREGFIRQLIGWREYMRYLYVTRYDEMLQGNVYRASKPAVWRTGLAPFDNEVNKAIKYGYAHHIVRLMVFMSLHIMMDTDPAELYRWFMEVVAIDAYDWVMVGNIYAMGYYYTCAMTRPYVSSSAYIARMSDYKKDGTWDKIWDALFYRFISRGNGVDAYKRNLSAVSASQLKEHIRVANEFLKSVRDY